VLPSIAFSGGLIVAIEDEVDKQSSNPVSLVTCHSKAGISGLAPWFECLP